MTDYSILTAVVLGLLLGHLLIAIVTWIGFKICKPKQHKYCWLVSYMVWRDGGLKNIGYTVLYTKEPFNTDDRFEEMLEHIATESGTTQVKEIVILSINKL